MIKYIFIMPLLFSIAFYTRPAENKSSHENDVSRMDMNVADTSVDHQITYARNKNVLRCTFRDASSGDCLHVIFSCGDFGLSERDLPSKDEVLWSSLYSDGPSGVEVNSDMVDKTFEITYQKTSVKACDGSEDLHQVDAPRLIGFKLVSQ